MTHDDRDRRDQPDEAEGQPEDGIEPAADAGGTADAAAAPEPDETATRPSTDSAASSAGGERSAWSTEPPAAGDAAPEAWPTEPPTAGESRPDAWPTTPPERGGEPILEPEPEPAAEMEQPPAAASDWDEATPAAAAVVATDADALQVEEIEPEAESPPPSEVEAYPAAAAATGAVAGAAAAEPAHVVPAAESVTGESTQCPRCGTENRPGLAFCRSCGQRLVAAGVAATVERPGTPEGTQACPRCGTHNRSGVAFCQNCGANLRGTAPGYVPPAVAGEEAPAASRAATGGAVLGPVVLLIGVVGLVTAYLLPFAFGTGSLFERAWGAGGHGIAFWSAYPDNASLADAAYYGLAAPVPILGALVLALAVAGFMRAAPGRIQTVGLVIALAWSVGLIVLFVVVELFGNWDGDIVALLRVLSPAGIILFLTSLIIAIGTLTRFARS
jgi:Double zinc ribbon